MASTTADAMTPLQAPPAMTQFQTPEKNSLLEGGQYEKAARGPTAANFTDSPNSARDVLARVCSVIPSNNGYWLIHHER